ncbi:MAG: hypothetical protein JWQ62_190 [Lacunisphaera sp.]|nr:hypothetical protein [Lacunisphaera sp.]
MSYPATLTRVVPGALSRCVALLFLGALSAAAAPVKFEIPAQLAPPALMAFSRQARVEVVFSADDLKRVRTNEVIGEFEPEAALGRLLQGTGFAAQRNSGGKFVVAQAAGSIQGSLVGEGGKSIADILVTVRETGQSTTTDKYGVYLFSEMAEGNYLLVATASGYQPLHIMDVTVRAGRDLTLGKEEMHHPLDEVTKLTPIIVHAESITQLDKFEVTGSKQKPFQGANVDLPRTINDVQPYYVFNAKTVDESGATNIEDFLKQRLTMNTTALTNSQRGVNNTGGNTSSINLRGVGTDKTLILVNGRRMPGISNRGIDFQPDLNGIPLSAIERIEVMPSSAAGIYGGSALGGVVNVILKKDYTGGEIRTVYDNTSDSDAARRTVAVNFGLTLEGGRTHLMLNGSWADANEILVQDRLGPILAARATINTNLPTFFTTASNPILGALPNIGPTSATQTTLTLKNGVVLPSNRTYISAGTMAGPPSSLYAMLIANAGQWNFDLPATAQDGGKLLPFDAAPRVRSLSASVRRQMLPKLEFFVDFSVNENLSRQNYSPTGTGALVPSTSSASPFTTDVNVTFPALITVPYSSSSTSRTFTFGAIAQLPWGWTGEFDYTWTKDQYRVTIDSLDTTATFNDRNSGALNLFADTLQFLDLSKYVIQAPFAGVSDLDDFALRGSGPLFHLPWGVPTLTFGLEHRMSKVPSSTFVSVSPIVTANSFSFTYFERNSKTDSGYAELTVPLVKKGWLPFVHAFELQAAGRREIYTADTGPSVVRNNFGLATPTLVYTGPTRNGQPFFSTARYSSNDYTVGFKYQPLPELTLRGSRGTAFLPPTAIQLSPNANPTTTTVSVTDPVTGVVSTPTTVSGGNADLTPQHAKSTNLGVIWEPAWAPLQGLRLDAEYYKIEQFDAIAALTAPQIVAAGSVFADRITRDATGKITQVNITSLNLYHLTTEGWDFSADYTRKTRIGTFNFSAVESLIEHLKTQYSLTLPEYEAAGYNPAENGAPQYKTNGTLTWEARHWTAGWATRFISSYKVQGAVGGPNSRQNANGGVSGNFIAAQGSNTVESQMYHDFFAGYAFGRVSASRFKGERLLDGVTVQIGVRNVFDKSPPLDVNNNGNATYYLSPYGDMRLRSYWLSVKKMF